MFQRALICTDLSDGLQRLIDFVPSLAASGMKQIVFLHSIPLSKEREVPRLDSKKVEAIRDRLSAAMQHVPSGVDVKIEVQWGKPADHIINLSKTYQSDVVLMGAASKSLLDEKLFGSTTMEVCQRFSTAVVTLRPQLISTYTTEELDLRCRHLFRYLLIPYDGSDASDYAVQQIKKQAQSPGSSLEQCLVSWVVDDGPVEELRANELKQAEEKVGAVKADLESVGLQVHTQVKQGNAVLSTLDAAIEVDISAIALSSNSLGKLLSWSIPSFAGELLRRSWHPVLYFPPTKG